MKGSDEHDKDSDRFREHLGEFGVPLEGVAPPCVDFIVYSIRVCGLVLFCSSRCITCSCMFCMFCISINVEVCRIVIYFVRP